MGFSVHSNFKFEAFPNDIVTRVIKVRLKYMHKEFLKNILNMSQYDCYICYYSISVSLANVRTSS